MNHIPLMLALISSTALVAADVTVPHGEKPGFTLTLPTGWDAEQVNGKTVIHPGAKHPHIQIWATTAEDLAAASTSVSTIVDSEVTHFVASTTISTVIAGAPATQLIGTGEEADDNDPSNAEVTLFTVNGVVYVLINHAEGAGAAKQRSALSTLLTTLVPAAKK